MTKTALTIAGSDPSGGAGIQADLKVFTLHGVYGLAVPAALTAQNTVAAFAVRAVPPDFIRAQLEAVFSDIEIGAVKTGMLLTAGAVAVVADVLVKYGAANLVIDPVTISSSGKRLLKKDAAEALAKRLFPLAMVVTPNRDEAEYYSGMKIESRKDAEKAARIIRKIGPANIIIKGGHMPGDAADLLFDGREFIELPGKRIEGVSVHGAGCVFSAALTAGLAKGLSVPDAASEAKKFVAKAIKKAVPVGKGRTPLGLL